MKNVLTIGLLLSLSYTAMAQHADIEVEVENGRLFARPRVGEGEFGEAPNPANVADEPGIEADDGVLSAGDVLGINAVDLLGKNLWYWDGVGTTVTFGDSPAALTIEHPVSGATTLLDSAASGGAAGFALGAADSEGGLHQDIEFVLNTPDDPNPGVYLFGLEVTSDQYLSSPPVYMVLASGIEEQSHELAVMWVEDTFGVPEPSSILMFGFALASCGWIRKC